MSLINKLHKGFLIGAVATGIGGAGTAGVGAITAAASKVELTYIESLNKEHPDVNIDTKPYTDKFEYNARICVRGCGVFVGSASLIAISVLAVGKKPEEKYTTQSQSS